MTIVDTSVAVAILKREPDHDAWRAHIRGRSDLAIPASCYLEAVMVMRTNPEGRADLERLLATYRIAILGSDARQTYLAADAFARYGHGSGHPARLNFGDCLAYGAAAAHQAPLLFKGEDFAATDVKRFEA